MPASLLKPDNTFDVQAIRARAKQYARRELRFDTGRTVRQVVAAAWADAWGDAKQSFQARTGIDCVEVGADYLRSVATDGALSRAA